MRENRVWLPDRLWKFPQPARFMTLIPGVDENEELVRARLPGKGRGVPQQIRLVQYAG
jgi:hypothetical protein